MAGEDPWAGFVDNGPAAPPLQAGTVRPAGVTAPPGQDPWAGFVDAGPGAKPKREVGAGEAALRGYVDTSSFGFGDEVKGLSEASGLPNWLGGFRAPVGAARVLYESAKGEPGEATKTYEQATKERRQLNVAAEEQHPQAYMAGQLGGAVIAPGLGAAKTAANVGQRALRAAGTGALQGGLYGVGSGETDADRAVRGAIGAGVGGVTGAVASPIIDVAGYGLGKAGEQVRSIYNTIRGEFKPSIIEDEAAKRIVASQAADIEARGPAWTPEEIGAAQQGNVPRVIADAGGERTMALARSAANQSPEARAALEETARERFAGQSRRGADFISGLAPVGPRVPTEPQPVRFARAIRDITGGAEAATDAEALRVAARQANRPAYERAYQAGDREIWSPQLEFLTSAPTVQSAMRAAVNKWRDWQVHDGFGGMNPGAVVQNGLLHFQPGQIPVFPNIQFWDYTARNIADRAAAALRAGKTHLAEQYGGIERQLKAQLDTIVPEYQDARQGAAGFFGARDAHEAGRLFVGSNANIGEARQAVGRMSAPERELFHRGYASELADRIERTGDEGSHLSSPMFASEAGRQRMQLGLGPQRAAQFEQHIAPDRVYHAFDGATDAHQAGQNFVRSNLSNAEAARMMGRMDPADRQRFSQGFAAELSDRMLELRDGQNIINQAFLTSPASKQRIEMALGPAQARQLEMYLRSELLVDRLRGALGNSTTARQLAEMGLAGAGTLAIGHGAVEGEWDASHLLAASLLFGAAYGKHRGQIMENSVARRIGEMLTSDDPAILQRGIKMVASSAKLSDALRTAGDKVQAALSGKVAPRAGLSYIQGPSNAAAEQQRQQ